MISSGPVLFIVIVLINRDVMHAGDEMSRNVCITATFTQQIVGQIVLGRVVFRTSLACYLHSYHAENILLD